MDNPFVKINQSSQSSILQTYNPNLLMFSNATINNCQKLFNLFHSNVFQCIMQVANHWDLQKLWARKTWKAGQKQTYSNETNLFFITTLKKSLKPYFLIQFLNSQSLFLFLNKAVVLFIQNIFYFWLPQIPG